MKSREWMNRTYKTIVADFYRGTRDKKTVGGLTFELDDLAAPDCTLFYFLGLGGAALQLPAIESLRGWGFEPATILTWHRHWKGMELPELVVGAWDFAHDYGAPEDGEFRWSGVSAVEHILVAVRGRPDVSRWGAPPYTSDVFKWGVTSHPYFKPFGFWRMVEAVSTGPYASVFVPNAPKAWDVFPEVLREGGADE